jgi:hypothetical protein
MMAKLLLFHGPICWLARMGNRYLMELQMVCLFGDEKITIAHILGRRHYRR